MNKDLSTQKKIIHIDMDCFFAAIEMRDNPKLKDLPVAIGGKPGTRSVICTANYMARKFGVHSALSSDVAARRCKDLIFIKPNIAKYKETSKVIQEIFHEYSELVEPLSLDEAYIDVTHSHLHGGSATLIAKEIQEKIFEKTSLTASAGVAPNKFLAKVASDLKKPAGLSVIPPDKVDQFIKTLDVKKISGVGKVTNKKLNDLKIFTCSDLQKHDEFFLTQHFGKMGGMLYDFARGVDHREVIPYCDPKSLSVEHTYLEDIDSEKRLQDKLDDLFLDFLPRFQRLNERYESRPYQISGAFIKVKFSDFQLSTAQEARPDSFFESLFANEISSNLRDLFEKLISVAYNRGNGSVRLLGIGINFKPIDENGEQLILFPQSEWHEFN